MRALADLKLHVGMAEALTVTGAQFVQVKDKLYITGGYGLSSDASFMLTYRQLTVVDVDATVDAVLSGAPVGDHIRQTVPDEYLRVTGGELEYLDGTFLLVFGQSFDFAYTPGTAGRYTHQVRPFQVIDDGKSVTIVKGTPAGAPASDPEFRRRDLNVVPVIHPDGRRGFTVFGGVFTPHGGPWSRPIDVAAQMDAPARRCGQTPFGSSFASTTAPSCPSIRHRLVQCSPYFSAEFRRFI